jgi:hypothetical protein
MVSSLDTRAAIYFVGGEEEKKSRGKKRRLASRGGPDHLITQSMDLLDSILTSMDKTATQRAAASSKQERGKKQTCGGKMKQFLHLAQYIHSGLMVVVRRGTSTIAKAKESRTRSACQLARADRSPDEAICRG